MSFPIVYFAKYWLKLCEKSNSLPGKKFVIKQLRVNEAFWQSIYLLLLIQFLMKLNIQGISVMHEFEGLKLDAYLCPANVPTIGWGNTRYEDGTPVKMGESISRERADELFKNIAENFSLGVKKLVSTELSENQFSSLVCFAYNVGLANLGRSTLLKKVNANPNDPSIREEFLRWNKAGGKELAGLTRRRKAEADLYFSV